MVGYCGLVLVIYSTFLLLPFGAGLIRGVYVTVRVTTSLTWRTLDRVVFGVLISKYLPLLLKSQSYGDRALRALKGERALRGESAYEDAGEAGMRSLPKGADEGADVG